MAFSRKWRRALKWVGAARGLLGPVAEADLGRFAVVSSPRSGTTWLVDLLNSHPQIACFSEIFLHDHFGNMPHGGRQDAPTWDSFSTLRLPGLGPRKRLQLYFEYLDREIYSNRHGAPAVGFKLMYSHAERGFGIPAYLKLARVSLVHLVRENHLDVLLSEETLRARKYHHAAPGAEVPVVQVELEAATLAHRLARFEAAIDAGRADFKTLGTPWLEVTYEELLEDPAKINRILEFLGVERCAESLTSQFKKLNPTDHRQTIANYDEVRKALRTTRFAGLLR